jgi:hypothetical protein
VPTTTAAARWIVADHTKEGMMGTRTIRVLGAAAVVALAASAACATGESDPVAAEAAALEQQLHGAHMGDGVNHAEVARWLAALRNATSQFQQFERAAPAGWDTPVLACMEQPGVGGMGFHFGNPARMGDGGELHDLAPELLVYEPQQNGRMRLVAVEYIVPFTDRPADGPAPSLHGVSFHRNDGLGIWVLHAWVWKHNRAGMFADWNPDVSCAHAS